MISLVCLQVGITAACAFVTPEMAAVIGISSGMAEQFVAWLLVQVQVPFDRQSTSFVFGVVVVSRL